MFIVSTNKVKLIISYTGKENGAKKLFLIKFSFTTFHYEDSFYYVIKNIKAAHTQKSVTRTIKT